MADSTSSDHLSRRRSDGRWTLSRRAAFVNNLLYVSYTAITFASGWGVWWVIDGGSAVVALSVVATFAVLSAGLGRFAVSWLTRAIATPISEIVEGARKLRSGQMEHRVTLPHADDEFEQLASSFNQMAARLEVDQKALGEMARNDELTGLANRREGRRALITEIDRTTRYGRPMAAVLLDIDNFKKVNDTYGHPAGDEILKTIASRLRTTVRPTDTVIRWGGEEFAVILPETDSVQGAAAAERLRHVIANEPILTDDGVTRLPITSSFGVASAPQHTASPDELMSCADQALYAAKQGGRNRVVVYPVTIGQNGTPETNNSPFS